MTPWAPDGAKNIYIFAHLDVKVVSAGLEAVALGDAGDDVDHVALVGELGGVVPVGRPVPWSVLQN